MPLEFMVSCGISIKIWISTKRGVLQFDTFGHLWIVGGGDQMPSTFCGRHKYMFPKQFSISWIDSYQDGWFAI